MSIVLLLVCSFHPDIQLLEDMPVTHTHRVNCHADQKRILPRKRGRF